MIPSFLRESSFCSFISQNIKPIQIALPFSLKYIADFSLSSIPKKKTDTTLLSVYRVQKSFPPTAVLHIIILLLIGIVILYAGVILIVLSLFNPILFVIVIAVSLRYGQWCVKSIRNHRKKAAIKKIKKLLEKENKEFYSRKLIRWNYDPDHNHIMVHNLRLCTAA